MNVPSPASSPPAPRGAIAAETLYAGTRSPAQITRTGCAAAAFSTSATCATGRREYPASNRWLPANRSRLPNRSARACLADHHRAQQVVELRQFKLNSSTSTRWRRESCRRNVAGQPQDPRSSLSALYWLDPDHLRRQHPGRAHGRRRVVPECLRADQHTSGHLHE